MDNQNRKHFQVYDNFLQILMNDKLIKKVKFPFKIGQAESFDDILIVLLEPPPNAIFNENIFGVSYDGRMLWQIQKVDHNVDNSPYINMGSKNNLFFAHNWDGFFYFFDTKNGGIIDRTL